MTFWTARTRIVTSVAWTLAASPLLHAQTESSEPPPSRTPPQDQPVQNPVVIQGKPWMFNRETRYSHSPPEIDGATITVTKKVSVEKLDEQPTVIDNNQREVFSRLPGVFISEQQNPDQLNLSYRGIGNPQESEYVLIMQDGIPLESDWI